jgi:O-antigen biosynthesis protein
MNPLVTCLCLTRDRRSWLPQAIACFRAQTYEPRELLIVAEGQDVSDIVPDEPGITLVPLASHLIVGAKRNVGCDFACGELIAHWDDDDYSASGRLEDQVRRLLESGRAVTGYASMRFTDGTAWWIYTGPPDFVLGSSLLYRKDWWREHPFPECQIGEDSAFVAVAAAAGQLDVAAYAGDLMAATIHPGNTSLRVIIEGDMWKAL